MNSVCREKCCFHLVGIKDRHSSGSHIKILRCCNCAREHEQKHIVNDPGPVVWTKKDNKAHGPFVPNEVWK